MNAKNLSLKFAFLTLAAAGCLWSLFWGNGLKQGIDLRGGHSIVFEIYGDEPGLSKKMISQLKKRVDPLGLRMLEWRPQGGNRFEVRMPAGKIETQQAAEAFRRSMEDLEKGNIQRSALRRLEQAKDRQGLTARLAGGDQELSRLLGDLVKAYDKQKQSGSQDDILAWEDRKKAVLGHNVAIHELRIILTGYVRPAELKAMEGQPKALKAVRKKKKDYEERIEAFRGQYAGEADRSAAIDKTIARYKAWTDTRQELEDPADLIRLIIKAGVLEFRIAPYGPEARVDDKEKMSPGERKRYVRILRETVEKEGPAGLARRTDAYLWFPLRKPRGYSGLVTYAYAGQKYILLDNTDENTLLQRRGKGEWALAKARPDSDERGLPAVGFEMNEAGARYMDSLTGEHIGYCMAILLDNEVYSAPVVQAAISTRGIITMRDATTEEVNDLIRILDAGSLPAKLNRTPVAQSTFGPTFGKTNREMGKQAAVWGLVAVAVFMLLYYLAAGCIADVALLLNIILVLGAMSLLGYVFTLPGIAGIILTIGIAVDANVLIFERLREEQVRGQPVRTALRNAYQRAFSAIFDANITTLITCLILGWVGTQEVRGFAITLGFGVMFSMFTALVVSRWVFQVLLDRRIITKSVFMLQIIGVPKVNWMSKRHFFWLLSAAMVGMGIASLVWQGRDMLGIEFSSGTQAVIIFRDDAVIDGQLPDADLVRAKFLGQAAAMQETGHPKYAKLADTARVEARIDHNKVERFLSVYDMGEAGGAGKGDGKVTQAEWKHQGRNAEFLRLLDANGDNAMEAAELRNLPELSYQVTTTETNVPLIRNVARDAFGKGLNRRTSCSFELARSTAVGELDLEVNEEGYAKVEPNEKSPFAEVMENYAGGVVFVFRNVSPAITVSEFQGRIRDIQNQPDFANKTLNPTEVVGLRPAKGRYSAFAVFVRSAQTEVLARAAATESLAEESLELISGALEREQAMVATNFDAAIAGKAAQTAIMAILLSWIAIVVYLWVRFGSIRWGLAAVVCLIHDVIIVVGLLAASGWLSKTAFGRALGIGSFKIDLAMVAAVLTVIGYSVNDTIVVFDRIRENRGKLATVSVHALNASINQTLSRTMLTSTTTLLVVVIMYVIGGEAIRPFSFALLAGILFGTYSSVAIASPLLMGFRRAMVARTTGAAAEKGD
ncbi:MAG: protein translocase subunit SecD [Phycisphaerae bacterium]|jgi:SecD/SecF fusion protein|nr:protein translocase subunit SecD [Phycisphaerae bacterium]